MTEWNLILTDNALTGLIPSEIGLMTGLRKYYLIITCFALSILITI
jgi:hypothetical protein